MLTDHASRVDTLRHAISSLADAARDATDADAVGMIVAALRAGDSLHALAVRVIAERMPDGGIERACGTSTEVMLQLDARRTGSESRMLTETAAALRALPWTADAFTRGLLSFGQVRAIVCAMRVLDAQGRAKVDELIGRAGPDLLAADPDELIGRVDDAASQLRPELARAREDRAVGASFLAVQPKLCGGGTLYGEADTESFATIVAALDDAAATPGEDISRARQRMDALVAICESSLGGDSGGSSRPKPRLIATVDIEAFVGNGLSEAARVLWALAGGPGRLTPVAIDVLACDAEFVPVLFKGARPVAVGDARSPVTAAMRTALIARDEGCRFPACRAPVSWCDAHHVTSRFDGGATDVSNLVLLCRRHHRTVHRHRWTITLHDDGSIEFARRGRRYLSPARRE